jgi:hypothetical protein
MSIEHVAQRHSTKDVQLNTVLNDYKIKINEIIDNLGGGGSGNGGGGASAYLDLTDTPGSYSGQAGKYPRVKGTEDGLEFGLKLADYLDQAVKIASSPIFNDLTLTKLTIGSYYLNSLIANNRVPDSAKLTASGFYLNSLIANNKVPDSDKVDGYHGAEASTAFTAAIRNTSGDIFTRLFRSEYASSNATIAYIMTQRAVGVGADNYLRPSTPAQLATALVSALEASFIRSNAADNVSANTEWQDSQQIRLGNSADLRMWHDGTNHYFRSYKHGVNLYIVLENASGTARTLAIFDPDAKGLIVGDHGSAATDMTVNVCYGTGSPPTASTTTIGTLFIKYSN